MARRGRVEDDQVVLADAFRAVSHGVKVGLAQHGPGLEARRAAKEGPHQRVLEDRGIERADLENHEPVFLDGGLGRHVHRVQIGLELRHVVPDGRRLQ